MGRLHWYVAVVSAKTAWLSFYPQLTLWSNCEKYATFLIQKFIQVYQDIISTDGIYHLSNSHPNTAKNKPKKREMSKILSINQNYASFKDVSKS